MVGFTPPEAVPVEGLGIASDEALWLGRCAGEVLRREAVRAGLAGGEDHVSLTPGAVATADTLRAFVQATRGGTGDAVGVLGGELRAWCDAPAFGPPARLRLHRGGGAWSAEREASAVLVELDAPVRRVLLPLADRPGGREVELVLSDAVLCSTSHWAGVLWANLLALGPALWRRLMGPWWWAPARLAWGVAWAWSLESARIAGALTRRERGARVHPSAVVEGAWLMAGARVGPGAVVRGAILGPGARVEAQALVVGSVLGPGAVVQRRGWVQFGVLHGGAAHGGAMQLGVLGPRSSVKGGAYLLDQSHRGVRARVAGDLVDAPLGLLGVGVGADALVGSGVWVAPGRTLEPGSRSVRAPELMVR